MKTKMTIIGVMGLILLVTAACSFSVNLPGDRVSGSGNVISEDRDVSGFDRVSLEGAGELIIEQGTSESLTVEADDNLMEYIITEVSGDTLRLRIKPNLSLFGSNKIVYHLTVIDLNAIAISGSGKVTAETLDAKSLKLSTSGSGKFIIDQLTADSVEASTSGSGEFDLTGTASSVRVDINGSGKFLGGDLQAATGDVSISGSGQVTTWVTDSLEVRISGSGSVRYKGSPSINQSISGSGSVRKIND
ncbi:MAG: DUF2807 domain-containing protein [Anaerolineae bacterium]|nr:DUF2807 domain-containing protein [Anaerolineae bacterium]